MRVPGELTEVVLPPPVFLFTYLCVAGCRLAGLSFPLYKGAWSDYNMLVRHKSFSLTVSSNLFPEVDGECAESTHTRSGR